MRSGTLLPGKGPDFPGDLGVEDWTGLLMTTVVCEPAAPFRLLP